MARDFRRRWLLRHYFNVSCQKRLAVLSERMKSNQRHIQTTSRQKLDHAPSRIINAESDEHHPRPLLKPFGIASEKFLIPRFKVVDLGYAARARAGLDVFR